MPRRSFAPRLAGWLVAASCALPLVVCLPAPLTDWPNHIARVWIGVRLLHDDPFWTRFYVLNPHPVPNLALDLGIGALHFAGVDVDVAAAAFLVLSLAVFVAGFCRFARAMDAGDASKPMLGGTLFLTGPLMYGLVNYVLGIGAMLWALAWWAESGPRAGRRWVVAVAATVLLFPLHLLAAAMFALVAGCMDAWSWRVRRPHTLARLVRSSSGIGAVGCFVLLLLLSPAGGDSMPRADGSNVWYPGHGHVAATVWWKGGIFVRMVADHASVAAAALTLAGLAVAAGCLAAPARGPAAPGSPPQGGAWFAVAVLLAIVLLLPESLGTGSLLDYRVALVPLAIAAATVRSGRMRPGLRVAAFVALAVVCLGRSLSFAADFHGEQAVFRAIEAAAARLPKGGIVLAARGLADRDIPQRDWWSPPLEHGASRAVFAEQFVPTVFAVASQQPVVLRPEFARWRRSWLVADAGGTEDFSKDAAPLCGPGQPWAGRAALFIAYPGRWLEGRPGVLASAPEWAIADVCRLEPAQE